MPSGPAETEFRHQFPNFLGAVWRACWWWGVGGRVREWHWMPEGSGPAMGRSLKVRERPG